MIARTPASPRQVERFVAAPGGLTGVDRLIWEATPDPVAFLNEDVHLNGGASQRATQPVAVMAALAACFVGSGDDDLVLGVVFSNRQDAELARSCGTASEERIAALEATFRHVLARALTDSDRSSGDR